MMSMDNGGYKEDKKSIEQSLEQNEIDHKAIIAQNERDHKTIIDKISDNQKVLDDIKDKYIPDVIILKTKINIFGVILTIFLVPAVALAYRFLEGWLKTR